MDAEFSDLEAEFPDLHEVLNDQPNTRKRERSPPIRDEEDHEQEKEPIIRRPTDSFKTPIARVYLDGEVEVIARDAGDEQEAKRLKKKKKTTAFFTMYEELEDVPEIRDNAAGWIQKDWKDDRLKNLVGRRRDHEEEEARNTSKTPTVRVCINGVKEEIAEDAVDEVLARARKKKLPYFVILKEFEDLEGIRLYPYRIDWKDDNLKNRVGWRINLYDDNTLIALAEHAFTGLQTKGCEIYVVEILILAWNLRSSRTQKPVFAGCEPITSSNSLDPNTLEEEVVADDHWGGTITFHPDKVSSPKVKVLMYTYVAACLLRLFTKKPQNFMNAWKTIQGKFQDFYKVKFPLEDWTFPEKSLNFIERYLSIDRFKNTLSSFLYYHNSIQDNPGIRVYCYEQHIRMFGFHVYSLMARVLEVSRVPFKMLIASMAIGQTEYALNTIVYIAKNYVKDPVDDKKRQTWRYCRLFDLTYFSDLQSKKNAHCIAFLAYLGKLFGLQENAGNLTQIGVIQNMSDEQKNFARQAAKNIHEFLVQFQE